MTLERRKSHYFFSSPCCKTIVEKEMCSAKKGGDVDWNRKGYHTSQDILIRYFNTDLLKYQHTSDIAAIHCTQKTQHFIEF